MPQGECAIAKDETIDPDDTEVEVEVVAETSDDAETSGDAVAVAADVVDDAETGDDADAETADVDDAETSDDAEAADDAEAGGGVVAGAVAVAAIDPDELAVIQEENAALKRQLAAAQAPKEAKSKPSGESTWRKVVVWVLIVLSIVSLIVAVSFVWAKTTLEDEDQFVATLEPLPKEEAVSSVVSLIVAERIVEALGVEAWVSESLPDDLGFLSVPVTNSVTSVVAAAANEFIQSDAFTPVWTGALRVTHKAAVAVINGKSGALVSEDGTVSIDLDEIAGAVVERVESTGLELPDADVEFGQIVIYEDEQLASVQSLAQLIDTAGWFLPLLAIVFIAAALWLSRKRRKTAAILGFGTAIGLALSLVALAYGRNALVDAIEAENKQLAAGQAWDLILERLYQLTWALLILALIVGVAAWVMGPGVRATSTRAWASGMISRWRRPAEDHPNGFTDFVAEWRATIEVVVVVMGVLFILFGPSPTGFSVLLTAVVALAVIVAVEVLAVPKPEAPKTQDVEVSSDT